MEFRAKRNADKGIPRDAVVIHKVQNRNGYLFTYLMTHKEDYEWKEREQFYEIYEGNRGAYLQVTVNQIRDDEADIRILCTFEPTMCTDDEVIRNAFQVGPS